MNQCSVCGEGFQDRDFDTEQNKCILHCEKNEDNGWYTLDENNKKIWNKSKVNLFWYCIQSNLNSIYENYMIDTDLIEKKYTFANAIFPKFQDEVEYFSLANNEDEMGTNFYSYTIFEHPNEQQMPEVNTLFIKLIVSFDNCTFLDDANFEKYDFEHELLFNECTFQNEMQLNKIYKNRISFLGCKINNLNCKDIVFEQKVKIQNCTINGEANFYNTKFKELADFYQTKFNKVVFERTDFEQIAVFSEAEFNNDVNFKYAKFLAKSIFRDTVIKGELDLRNTIFDDDANFLDITAEKRKKSYKDEYIGDAKEIKVSNRETARIIKNFYDTSNNIIEANKFYALEMEKREYELNEAVKEGRFRFILEHLIFKIHGITSNHSQDWFLSLLWIFNITFAYAINSSTNNYHNNMLVTIFFYSIVLSLFIYQNPHRVLKIILILSTLIFLFLSYIDLDTVADKINPFSIMATKDPITFGLLIFKITIAYLIYQFIVSVRQNTRRK
jgi:hypothetical protein